MRAGFAKAGIHSLSSMKMDSRLRGTDKSTYDPDFGIAVLTEEKALEISVHDDDILEIDLSSIGVFDRDDGNRSKNWIRHQVSATECEEVFFKLPLFLLDDIKHSHEEKRFYVLGQANADRKLSSHLPFGQTKFA